MRIVGIGLLLAALVAGAMSDIISSPAVIPIGFILAALGGGSFAFSLKIK